MHGKTQQQFVGESPPLLAALNSVGASHSVRKLEHRDDRKSDVIGASLKGYRFHQLPGVLPFAFCGHCDR